MRRCPNHRRARAASGWVSFCSVPILVVVILSSAYGQTARLVAKEIIPSVLTLEVYDTDGEMISRASAFFVTPKIVATSLHALRGGSSAYAHTSDRAFNFPVAGVVAVDEGSDVALLELVAANGRPLVLAKLDSFEAGEEVFVFGSPKGLDGSVTTGIVSGGSLRSVANMQLIQISAPISPGNSGGPVVNRFGEVIGLATLTVDGGRNLNFAVPASKVRALVARIGPDLATITSLGTSDLRGTKEPACCGDGPLTLPSGRDAGFYVREGERFYDVRRFEEAKEAFKRAIDLEPKNAWAHFALAHTYLRLRCEKRAITTSRQAVILKPKDMKIRDGLGFILIDFGRYREAARVYEELLAVDAKQPIARTRLGICYFSLDRFADAAAAFKEALRVDSKCSLARFWLGKTYVEKLGDRAAAVEQYRVLQKEDAALAEEMGEILDRR